MKTWRSLAGSAVLSLVLAATAARAQDRLLTGDDLYPWRGWYVSVFGGVRLQPDERSTATSIVAPGVPSPFRHGFANGFSAGVALGRSWRLGASPWAIRLEGEYAYARNGVDKLYAGMTRPGTGALQSYSFMANAYVDYRWRRLIPYVGGGVGVALMDLNAATPTIPGATFGTGRDTNLAVQAIAGIDVLVLPRWRLGVAYKYQAVFGNKFDLVLAGLGKVGDFDVGTITSHTILVRLSYLF